jgi:hypothetical protein
MKIQLERTLTSCPNTLRCTICSQAFEVGRIRTLLYSDRRLLQGDICSDCFKLDAKAIKLKMRQQAERLLSQPALTNSRSQAPHNLALELFEVSKENIKFPAFYQRLAKRIEVFVQASQELEAARLGLSNCQYGRRSSIQITFSEDEP